MLPDSFGAWNIIGCLSRRRRSDARASGQGTGIFPRSIIGVRRAVGVHVVACEARPAAESNCGTALFGELAVEQTDIDRVTPYQLTSG